MDENDDKFHLFYDNSQDTRNIRNTTKFNKL